MYNYYVGKSVEAAINLYLGILDEVELNPQSVYCRYRAFNEWTSKNIPIFCCVKG